MYPLSPVKANVAVCAGGVEVRVADALETLVWLRFLRFSRLFRGRKRKQSAMGLSRDKITVCVYKGYIGKGRKEPDPLRAG